MRACALLVGCWCGSLQLSMVYGLSFLWSATPRTALWILLAWLAGSLLGVQRGRARISPWHWLAPVTLMISGFHFQATTLPLVLISSLLSGFAGGHWLALVEEYLVIGLRWESIGMGAGFMVAGSLAFLGLDAMQIWCGLVTGLTCWKEERWRDLAMQGFR